MPADAAVAHIDRVCRRWPDIQAALGAWGAGLVPDEGVLVVPQVLAQSDRLAAGQTLAARGVPGRSRASSNGDEVGPLQKQLGW
jgi:hypothetical protein